ncbi:hypothetical protein [Streptosporangium canum]|uniref:hypothetical protein n=1 Tax=Streptosporangium canum TaxID=324952 RepID=UPI0033BA4112
MTTLTEALFDLAPAIPVPRPPATPQHRTHAHTSRPRRNPEHRAAPCNPTCITCGHPEHPEGLHYCHPTCLLLCEHTNEASLADVCIVTTHVTAELITSPHTGKQHAVITCPHCERTHRHAPTPGRHHRISSCGRPYIVHLAAPEATA